MLNSLNEALGRLAARPGGIDALPEEEIDERVMGASLNDLSDYLGVSRREAAAIVADLFKEGQGLPNSPLAKVRRIAAGSDHPPGVLRASSEQGADEDRSHPPI
ncbi:MAG: hypothetical protein ACRDH8_06845 [Actinomycetota bacterium]